uniref:Uncharacterized protein n=1 Tax=Myripristis murdjan TaxID=586833 RepID=A0A667YXN3_9TELE
VWEGLKRAARLLLCKLAWTPSRLARGEPCLFTGVSAMFPGVIMPVHLLICFCRYLRWLTFLLDFTGLSRASLILLESPSFSASPRRLPSRLFSMSYSITDPGKQKFMNWGSRQCTLLEISPSSLTVYVCSEPKMLS